MRIDPPPIAIPVNDITAAVVPQHAQQIYPGLAEFCERLYWASIGMMVLEWLSTLIYISLHPKCSLLIMGSAAGLASLFKHELRGLDFYMIYLGLSNVIWFEQWRNDYLGTHHIITAFHYGGHTLVQVTTAWIVIGFRHYERWYGMA